MTTETPDLDQYRLETIFEKGYVIHTTYGESPMAEQLEVGEKVKKRWTSGDKIGAGGFGVVLRQEDERGQLRAVKKLNRDILAAKRVDFYRELNTLVKLKDHPKFFVRFLGWYDNEDYIFLAMEYIQHGDLGQYLKSCGPKAKLEAKEITRQLLGGLVIMHKENICHRDLKPQNILIAATSPVIWVKITDFGLSKHEQNTHLRTNCGTTSYKAPELQGLLPRRQRYRGRGPVYTNAVDLWSLGALVHEILTFEIPFVERYLEDDPSGTEFRPPTDTSEWVDLPDMDLMRDYCHGDVEFPVGSLERSSVSKSGIDFVKKLLTADPQSRISAADAIGSPWLSRGPCYARLARFIKEENPGLKKFFPQDLDITLDSYLETAIEMVETLESHGCPSDIANDLAILTLYDLVVLIDDSSSMRFEEEGRRIRDLEVVFTSLTQIYTLARKEGILSTRFLNTHKGRRNVTYEKIPSVLEDLVYYGVTRVGTELRRKIIDRFAFGRRGEQKPLLVITFIGGTAEGEKESLLGDVISYTITELQESPMGPAAIAFQFSQLGNDKEGAKFLDNLSKNNSLRSHVDYQSVPPHLRNPNEAEQYWVLMAKILLGAIVPVWKEHIIDIDPTEEEQCLQYRGGESSWEEDTSDD